MSRPALQEKYLNEIVPVLHKDLNISNRMRLPRLSKIIVNSCLKDAVQDSKLVNSTIKEVAAITGQQPVRTVARKSIANFKLREGMPLGCRVTLRGHRMYDFLLKLISVALPRVRDFKGISRRGFDGRGNYTFGLNEQGIFPEINLDKVQHTFGMNITLVTTAESDAEGRRLLELFGLPFRKN
jgi:large subunit ribosomal protein L5